MGIVSEYSVIFVVKLHWFVFVDLMRLINHDGNKKIYPASDIVPGKVILFSSRQDRIEVARAYNTQIFVVHMNHSLASKQWAFVSMQRLSLKSVRYLRHQRLMVWTHNSTK